MKTNYAKSTVLASLIWKFLEQTGTSGIQFFVQIVLARLLLPKYFGTIAIVGVVNSFANVLIQGGFNMALVQKKDANDKDFSSVFYLSLTASFILYLVIYFTAPLIASFYNDTALTSILRVLSLTLFIGAFNSIQNAYVSKHMMFKKLFISSLGAVFVSGTLGITAAFLGAGIWTLVIQQLASQFTVLVILWFTVKWRPRLEFSFSSIRSLFTYGGKLLVSSIVYMLFQDLRTLVIGHFYNPSTLGYYNRGERFPSLIVNNIDGSIQSVMFPTFSAYQDDKTQLKALIRRSILTSSFIIFPAMVGLAMIAEPLVKILLTDKWLPAVPFLQIFCFTYAIRPLQGVNLQIINAMGRSDLNLKLLFLKRGFELAALIISVPFGVHAIAIGAAISSVFGMIVNMAPNKKLLNYSLAEQLYDISPSLSISVFMGIVIYLFNFLKIEPVIIMSIQIVVGISMYFIIAKLFKIDSLKYITNTLIPLIKNKDKEDKNDCKA